MPGPRDIPIVPDFEPHASIIVTDIWHQHLAVDIHYHGRGREGLVDIVKIWIPLEMVTQGLQGQVVLPVMSSGRDPLKPLEVKNNGPPWYAGRLCSDVYGTSD